MIINKKTKKKADEIFFFKHKNIQSSLICFLKEKIIINSKYHTHRIIFL